MENKEIEVELKNPYLLVLIGFLFVVFYFETSVTLNGPIAFGDEGYHTYIAKEMGTLAEYPIFNPAGSLIHKEGFSRPPLFNLFEGSFYFLFGFNEIIIKFLLPVLSFFLGLGGFVLFRRLYSDPVGFISAVILVTVPAIVTYSVLFYVDIFFVYWFLFAVGFFLLAIKEEKKKYFLFSGIFAAFAILTKTPGYILIAFYGLYFLYELWQKKNIVLTLKKYIPLGIIVALVLVPFYLRNYAYYKTPLCGLYFFPTEKCNIDIQYTNQEDFAQNTQNVSTNQNVYQLGLTNYFQFAYGFLWFVPVFAAVGIIYVLMKKEKLEIAVLLLLLVGSPLFLLTYQGRAEDASRYTLFVIPFLALLMGIYFEKIMETLKRHYKYFGVIFLLLILAISYYNFSSKVLMMPQVKQFSQLFFDACNWVKTNTPQNAILLSFNTHPTVYNCQREAIWALKDLPDIVLSRNVTLVTQRLKANGIEYIFVQKFSLSSQNNGLSYPLSFIAFLEQNPQVFKKVFENGPSYNSCVQTQGCDGTAIYQVIG